MQYKELALSSLRWVAILTGASGFAAWQENAGAFIFAFVMLWTMSRK